VEWGVGEVLKQRTLDGQGLGRVVLRWRREGRGPQEGGSQWGFVPRVSRIQSLLLGWIEIRTKWGSGGSCGKWWRTITVIVAIRRS